MKLTDLTVPFAMLLSLMAGVVPTVAVSQPTHSIVDPKLGMSFDRAIADAKAMMLLDPAKTVERAQAAEEIAKGLQGRARIIGIATAEWLQGEAYLRINDSARAAPLIEQAIKNGCQGRSADEIER